MQTRLTKMCTKLLTLTAATQIYSFVSILEHVPRRIYEFIRKKTFKNGYLNMQKLYKLKI